MSSQKALAHSSTGTIELQTATSVEANVSKYVKVGVTGADPGTRVDVRLALEPGTTVRLEPEAQVMRVYIKSDGNGSRQAKVTYTGHGTCVLGGRAQPLAPGFQAVTVTP